MPKIYPPKLYACARCGESKPATEMRHPDAHKGKAPSTCHQCRTSDPLNHWCDFHEELHSVESFQRVNRPYPYHNVCKRGLSEKASIGRDLPHRTCVACKSELPSHSFRGGNVKSPTCRSCQSANPGKRWCAGCAGFLSEDLFTRTGRNRKFQATRCKPCRTTWVHGVTVSWILAKQGSTEPECASCGSKESLKVDHDHNCCPSATGCENCVRGYLCHECNTAEGLLRSSERAQLLVAYMQRQGL